MRNFLIAIGLLVFSSEVHASCTSSTTHFCVSHNGFAFAIDGTQQMELTLDPGTAYVFEADTGDFGTHPFILTRNAVGGTATGILTSNDGISGTLPLTAAGQTVTYTPQMADQNAIVYYQCEAHTQMGAAIQITGPDMAMQPDLLPEPDMATIQDLSAASHDLAGLDMTPASDDMAAPGDQTAAPKSSSCSFATAPEAGSFWLLGLLLLALAARRARSSRSI